MENSHPLKTLLQLQLASDASSVLHLPYVLDFLSPEHFGPSPHTQKWAARINSLLHSKDSSARWAGLCVAFQTSVCSRDIMIEHAQGWIGVALPILSKDEPPPTLKASVRLLRRIFSTTVNIAEFQRQLCLPNVPKFSSALIELVQKKPEEDLKLLALAALTHLIPLYPTLHRSLHSSLSSLALKFLNGSSPRPTPESLAKGAARLYATLHVTGGKVGAGNIWRTSLDETLSFAWTALYNLRTTYDTRNQNGAPPYPSMSVEDPIISIPLNMDRLRAAAYILCDLLLFPTPRPVIVPVGSLVKLCSTMLRCTPEEQAEGQFDSATRAMEVAIIPAIWRVACDILIALSESVHYHLSLYLPRLLSVFAYHLEQERTPSQRLCLLRAIPPLLSNATHFHDTVLASRLAKVILTTVTTLLTPSSQALADRDATASKNRSKRAKKRGRGYEGDEVFKIAAEIVCSTPEEGEGLLVALDALHLLMQNSLLSPPVYSIVSRALLAILIALPQRSPLSIAPDLSLHGKLSDKLRFICTKMATGTSSTMSRSLSLVIGAIPPDGAGACGAESRRCLDLLLHPRVPPLVRSIPHVETLSLFREEEGDDEKGIRKSLGLSSVHDGPLFASSSATPPAVARDRPDGTVVQSGSSRDAESAFILSAVNLESTVQTRAVSSNLTQSIPSFSSTPTPTSIASAVKTTPDSSMGQHGSNSPQLQESTPMPSTEALYAKTNQAIGASVSTIPPSLDSFDTVTVIGNGEMDRDEDEPMPTIDMGSDSDSN
ncbi:uncharacterized protein FIBRA_07784 [Fibroporia radiculosa]|uniref:Pre-rRNA-processing protein RIX1 n=1 Tax=Fibroporia radiculosa TaxID=599839 RepID=J4I1C8_9APHY|nr:uncharacterized protein FIBRA_07784 [Fibroporia radiculosa]CCM05557.1 predicted protein [Fibroporia radiculosa]